MFASNADLSHAQKCRIGQHGPHTAAIGILLVAINAADYKSDYVLVHAKGARAKGATEAHLVEACVSVIPFAGVAAWLPASEGIMGSRI